ncbi:iron chaperone [Spirosoma sordidisoli]|uniref:DUF1801 domain-containing protein n=1 Tax=Spirosoma sordidisoli TaxID=2502893 RepID=A0A4Q2UR75_9BACT|nr:DUF1801 domain-containing protein [Spirosoma sordidisoli]RYC70160.1 DUF1801 domain-containing protein [Spirosoma sordidisoli]
MTTQVPSPHASPIDAYIDTFPAPVQERLRTLRQLIQDAQPDAEETFSYGMPAFKRNDVTIWFAAYKKHIGLYPMYGMALYNAEMAPYRGKGTKDALHFPHDQPLPTDLLVRLVQHKFSDSPSSTPRS